VTDETTKSDGKSRRPNREVIMAAFLWKDWRDVA